MIGSRILLQRSFPTLPLYSSATIPMSETSSAQTLAAAIKESCKKTAFISGALSPPPGYFSLFYQPLILSAITSNHYFVLGPSRGIDTIALKFLLENGVSPSHITVYLAEFERRKFLPKFKSFTSIGGKIKVSGSNHTEQDAAMTRDSDYDILRYMTAEEQQKLYGAKYKFRISGTELNERRRKLLLLNTDSGETRE